MRVCVLSLTASTAFLLLMVMIGGMEPDKGNIHSSIAFGYHIMRDASVRIQLKTGKYPGFGGFEDLPSYLIAAGIDIAVYSAIAAIPLTILKVVRDISIPTSS